MLSHAMHHFKLTAAVWSTGIAAVLMLGLLVVHANEPVELTPLSLAEPNPAVQARIRAFETGARGITDLLSFDGPDRRPVYLFTAPCCDHFNPLYDAEGRRICAPSGGISGAGDGRCPAWVSQHLSGRVRLPSRRGEQPSLPR